MTSKLTRFVQRPLARARRAWENVREKEAERFSKSNADGRLVAVSIAKKLHASRAVPLLIRLARDSDPLVMARALHALARFKRPDAQAHVELVASEGRRVSGPEALIAMGRSGNVRFVPFLERAARHRYVGNGTAVQALIALDHRSAIEALGRVLADSNQWHVHAALLDHIQTIQRPEIVGALVHALGQMEKNRTATQTADAIDQRANVFASRKRTKRHPDVRAWLNVQPHFSRNENDGLIDEPRVVSAAFKAARDALARGRPVHQQALGLYVKQLRATERFAASK